MEEILIIDYPNWDHSYTYQEFNTPKYLGKDSYKCMFDVSKKALYKRQFKAYHYYNKLWKEQDFERALLNVPLVDEGFKLMPQNYKQLMPDEGLKLLPLTHKEVLVEKPVVKFLKNVPEKSIVKASELKDVDPFAKSTFFLEKEHKRHLHRTDTFKEGRSHLDKDID
nr:hypothetical protein [Cressdnaviricota sp.]